MTHQSHSMTSPQLPNPFKNGMTIHRQGKKYGISSTPKMFINSSLPLSLFLFLGSGFPVIWLFKVPPNTLQSHTSMSLLIQVPSLTMSLQKMAEFTITLSPLCMLYHCSIQLGVEMFVSPLDMKLPGTLLFYLFFFLQCLERYFMLLNKYLLSLKYINDI